MRLENKVTVITGAGSGLGRASAHLFAEHGAKVVAVDIVGDRAKEVADQICAKGFEATSFEADVADEPQAAAAIDAAVDHFGKLDVLYSNAGIELGFGLIPAEQTELASWQRVMDVNLTASFLLSKHAIPHLRANSGGAIVITSSIAAQVAMNQFPAYCASKAGVEMFAKTLALEVGRWNIRVNCVAPGGGMSINLFLEPGAVVEEKSLDELVAERHGWNPNDWPYPLKSPQPHSFLDNAYAALYLASEESKATSGIVLSSAHGGSLHMSSSQATPLSAEQGVDGSALVDAVTEIASLKQLGKPVWSQGESQ